MAQRRVERFLRGEHPFLREGRLGRHWPPPVAVASWVLEKARGGIRHATDEPLSSAGEPASPPYRASVLAAMGLDEEELSELVQELREERRKKADCKD